MGLFKSSEPKHTTPPARASSMRAPTTNGANNANLANNRHSLHRNHAPGTGFVGDPSIAAAQQRVIQAENAEREADKALIAARNAVAEARAHVKRLELEAAEEARRARLKQEQAARLGERAEPLGRHDPARRGWGFGRRNV